MRVIALAVCAVALTGAQGSSDLERNLDALLAPAFRAGEPGGVVLVGRDGKVVFRRAYGLANVEQRVPMPPDAVMLIGSVTKQFTAVGILKLVEQRKIALADDVRRYVPGLQTHGRTVTIEHLLTHTSGLATMVDVERFWAIAQRDHDLDSLLGLTRDRSPHFEPGADFRYNDSGYVALGAIIERVAGVPYAAFIESLVRPLGMQDTWYADGNRIIPRRAAGYSVLDGRIVNAPHISMTVPHAAGALASTADDLLRWNTALRRGEVIGSELRERAWTPRTLPDGISSGYGFGWHACEVAGRRTFEHGGWINGFTANVIGLRDEPLDVIVLVNRDTGSPDAPYVARRVARAILTGAADVRARTLDAAERRALTGTYREKGTGTDAREILEKDGALHLAREGSKPQPLLAISATELTPADSAGTFVLTFELAKDGRATSYRTRINCELSGTFERGK